MARRQRRGHAHRSARDAPRLDRSRDHHPHRHPRPRRSDRGVAPGPGARWQNERPGISYPLFPSRCAVRSQGSRRRFVRNRRVDMLLAADPAEGLFDEAILEVVSERWVTMCVRVGLSQRKNGSPSLLALSIDLSDRSRISSSTVFDLLLAGLAPARPVRSDRLYSGFANALAGGPCEPPTVKVIRVTCRCLCSPPLPRPSVSPSPL